MIEQLTLTKENFYYITMGEDTIMRMLDGSKTTTWFPGWKDLYYPAQVLVDLKGIYFIDRIHLYDYSGSPTFNVYAGMFPSKDKMELVISEVFDKYDVDRIFTIQKNAKFLILEIPTVKAASPSELKIFGELIQADPIFPPHNPPDEIIKSVDPVIGGNSFHWMDLDLTPWTMVREFQDWGWYQNNPTNCKFEPSYGGAGAFDTHYAAMKASGKIVVPCINNKPKWMNVDYPTDVTFRKEHKPLDFYGADPEQPASYTKFAQFFFQFAARYGKVAIDHSRLNVDTAPRWTNDKPNTIQSGLDLISYIEVWNESNKNWIDRLAHFTPYEFAAMMSACYDGHCGTIPDAGVKAADPDMQVVMGGLASIGIEYIKAMDIWFKYNRPDGKSAYDILNVHHYCNTAGAQRTTSTMGISPEAGTLKERMLKLIEYRNQMHPNTEVWISEYGYDTGTSTTQRAPAIGSMDQFKVQAIWLIRSYLELIAAGVDRSMMYMLRDENTENMTGLYSTSGLLKKLPNYVYEKKASWDYTNNFRTIMKDYCFAGDISSSDDVKTYKFKHLTEDKYLYVVWLPSSTDSSIPSYIFNTDGRDGAKVINLKDPNSSNTIETIKNVDNDFNIMVSISEDPILIETWTLPIISSQTYDSSNANRVYINGVLQELPINIIVK